MMRLKDWWIYIARPEVGGNTDGNNGPVEIRAVGGDKRIKMSEMTAGVFCDLVVEVSPRLAHTLVITLMVFDRII